MAKVLKPRRGSTAQNNGIRGQMGEITYDTTKNTLVCRDGEKYGGYPLAKEEDVAALDSAIRALIAAEVAKYLPLAGGTMSGGILFTPPEFSGLNVIASKSHSRGYIQFCGGTGYTTGASLALYGMYHDKDPAAFILRSASGEKLATLTGDSSGKLTWVGKNLTRSVNGQDADANGAVRTWAVNLGDVSADTLTEAGVYYLTGSSTNLPNGTSGHVIVQGVKGSVYVRQIFFRVGTVGSYDHEIYTRLRSSDGTWGPWVKMLTSKDIDNSVRPLNSTNVKVYSDASATLPSGGTWAVIGHSSGSGHDANICGTYSGGTKVSMTDYGGVKFILALKIA